MELNDDEIKSYKDAFEMFNTTGDGRITVERLKKLLEKLKLKSVPDEELEKIIEKVSEGKKKDYFDINDFEKFMNKNENDEEKEKEIINAFS